MVSIVRRATMPTYEPTEEVPTTPGSKGHVKEPPVCLDSFLKATAMPTEELAELVFPEEASCTAAAVSSSSSTGTGDSVESAQERNAVLSTRQRSRQGRATQRWATNGTSGSIRLVTGCVPILKGGKILFVSASRKSEWILPKGGWEQDESMEESAVRECFEEAGVLGVLGPKLTEVQYETRKAKKRRLELAGTEQHKKVSVIEENNSPLAKEKVSEPAAATTMLSDEAITMIRQGSLESSPKSCEETASVASSRSGSVYSQVRMVLFPLYVQEVASTWPESGRFRKAVDLDKAIEMLDSRPEFKRILQEVKDQGLHLVKEPKPPR